MKQMKKIRLKWILVIAFLLLAFTSAMAIPSFVEKIDHGKLGVADTSLVDSVLQITTGNPETQKPDIRDWVPCWGANPWSKDGQWIVYQSWIGDGDGEEQSEICIIRPDGSGYKRLTDNQDPDTHGSFTPDGKKIVFQKYKKDDAEIWIMNRDGSGQISLTGKHASISDDCGEVKPMVSPDGTKIAFLHDEQIYVMNIDGSNVVKVSGNLTRATKHSWSPDSAWVLFNAATCDDHTDCRLNVYKVRADGKALTRLTNDQNVYCSNWPAWSPDGKWISYHRRDREDTNDYFLMLMRADGSGKTVLAEGTSDADDDEDSRVCGPHSWHPGSEWIAFKRYESCDNTSLYAVNIKTKRIHRLTEGYSDGRMWWSPKGRHILFKEYSYGCSTRDGGLYNQDLLILNMDRRFDFKGSAVVDTYWIDHYTYDGDGVTNESHTKTNGKCFIATAAFGSPLAGQVRILQNFRDRYLMTNAPGRKFVAWYYQNGPVAADWIKDRPLAKAAVQAALYPLIGFSFLLLSGYMPVAALGFLLAALFVVRFREEKLNAT